MVQKRQSYRFDAAGWLFWTVVFVVLLGPSLFAVKKAVWDDTGVATWVGFGIICAAIGAGIVSWAVNAIIQSRRKKQRLSERKKARKQR